jgi:uncharacterized protein YggE
MHVVLRSIAANVLERRYPMLARTSALGIACLAVLLWRPLPVKAQFFGGLSPSGEARSVQVSAVGEVVAEPDYAVLDLAIESRATQLADARRDNDTRAKAVLKAVREFRIESKDVQTSQIRVSIEQETRDNQTVVKYVYRKGFRVVVRDFKGLETVLNSLIDAGINRVDQVQFDTTRRAALEAEAREKAVQAVGAKARAVARSFGQSLGQPLSILLDESPDAFRGGLGGSLPEHDPTIAGGQLHIRISASVIYGLLDDKRDAKVKAGGR